jgi:large subunit ribosomal protein L18
MLTTGNDSKRLRRRLRIRKKVIGTAERPRLCVCKTLKHLHVQVIDDSANDGLGRTVVTVTTNTKENRASGKKTFANVATAKLVGRLIGEKARAAGVETVVFDRSGFPYHGVVKALADAAREAGLKF